MKGAEQGKVEVTLLTPDQWERLREIRLSALKLNPEAFGAKYEDELLLSEQQWRDRFVKEDYLVASINGKDAGTLYIEVLNGDHGATCWIGGCWTDPIYRGNGVMRALFNYIDDHALEKDWVRQGLGVWVDNLVGKRNYINEGFVSGFTKTNNPSYFREDSVIYSQ